METKHLLGNKISLGPYQSFIEELIELASGSKSHYICVANVHMLVEADKAGSFREIINNSEIVTPDGEPLTWALKFLNGIKQDRVAGMDLLPDLLSAAEKKKIPVAFYGGTQDMLDRTKAFITRQYPNLPVPAMFSPPFRTLTIEEDISVINLFNDSGARLIFVVLGCPKQEKWMASMKNRIHSVMIGIGGALPVLVGLQKRAPAWMQHSGLEWLFRLGQEPRRLFKRYASTNTRFVYLIMREKFFKTKRR